MIETPCGLRKKISPSPIRRETTGTITAMDDRMCLLYESIIYSIGMDFDAFFSRYFNLYSISKGVVDV